MKPKNEYLIIVRNDIISIFSRFSLAFSQIAFRFYNSFFRKNKLGFTNFLTPNTAKSYSIEEIIDANSVNVVASETFNKIGNRRYRTFSLSYSFQKIVKSESHIASDCM
jgi:hypothetical protein